MTRTPYHRSEFADNTTSQDYDRCADAAFSTARQLALDGFPLPRKTLQISYELDGYGTQTAPVIITGSSLAASEVHRGFKYGKVIRLQICQLLEICESQIDRIQELAHSFIVHVSGAEHQIPKEGVDPDCYPEAQTTEKPIAPESTSQTAEEAIAAEYRIPEPISQATEAAIAQFYADMRTKQFMPTTTVKIIITGEKIAILNALSTAIFYSSSQKITPHGTEVIFILETTDHEEALQQAMDSVDIEKLADLNIFVQSMEVVS